MSDEVRVTSSTGGQKGTKQARYDLIPTGPLKQLAELYGRGAMKYADRNWEAGYDWSLSFAALCRHLFDFWGGADLDTCPPDGDGCSFVTAEGEPFESEPGSCYNHTGKPLMAQVAWHAFALLEFMENHPDFDNRPSS